MAERAFSSSSGFAQQVHETVARPMGSGMTDRNSDLIVPSVPHCRKPMRL